MKKTRKMNVIMLALVAALVMTTLTIALVACNGHQHSFYWQWDEEYHWQVCADCGRPTSKEAHTVDEWETIQPATYDADGRAKGICTVCEATVYMTLTQLPLSPGDVESENLFVLKYHNANGDEEAYYSISSYKGNATEVVFPSTYKDLPVKEIEFNNTSWDNVKAFVVEENNPIFQSKDGILYKKADKSFVCVPDMIEGEIEILDGVVEIPDNAFNGRNNITKITIPDSVTSIGKKAFNDCDQIEQVIVPKNVTHVGQLAFGNMDDLSSIEWHATECEVDGYVTGSITYGVFYGCGSLLATAHHMNGMMVSISENVKRIDDYTFAGLDIYGVYFWTDPRSELTSIGEYAFAHCHTLVEVNHMPAGINVADTAFYDSTTLMDRFNGINPQNLQEIGEDLWFDISNDIYRLVAYTGNAADALYNLPVSENNAKLRGRMYDIAEYALAYSKHGVISIPKCVRNVDYNAFYGCTGERVELKNYEEGEYLSEQDGIVYKYNAVGEPELFSCERANNDVVLLNGIKSIPNNAFSSCRNLQTLTIPSSVTSIGYSAFYHCTGITKVNYLGNLKGWCEIEFENASANPLCEGKAKLYVQANGGEKEVVGEVNIPVGMTKIGNYVFLGLTGITSVNIPDSVTSIGDGAFNSCTNLQTVTIPDSVTSIGEDAFYNCTGLQTVTIPDSVTSIGERAFSYCTGLKTITVEEGNTVYQSKDGVLYKKEDKSIVCVPEGIEGAVTILDGCTSIGDGEFSWCTGLQTLTIPDSVTSIGESAFYNCTGLQTVTIGNGVTEIDRSTFQACGGLQTVTIGNGVTNIDYTAFLYCHKLKSFTVAEGNPMYQSKDGVLYSKEGKYICLVPEAIEGAVAILDGCTIIGEWEFSNCTGLSEITIPDSVTSIGWGAFMDCTNLQTVTIGSGVTIIEPNAFYNTGLQTVYYNGTSDQLDSFSKSDYGNDVLYVATRYYFSEQPNYDGNHWHWNGDHTAPEVWVKEN